MQEVSQKSVKKQQCVACQDEVFVGDLLEVLDYLCEKHKKEYLKERAIELRDYLDIHKKCHKKI